MVQENEKEELNIAARERELTNSSSVFREAGSQAGRKPGRQAGRQPGRQPGSSLTRPTSTDSYPAPCRPGCSACGACAVPGYRGSRPVVFLPGCRLIEGTERVVLQAGARRGEARRGEARRSEATLTLAETKSESQGDKDIP